MTRTPYKDELIRVGAILGLPDDTEAEQIAQAVAARIAEHDEAKVKVTELEATMRMDRIASDDIAAKHRDLDAKSASLRAVVEGAESQLQQVVTEIAQARDAIQNSPTPKVQAYATLTTLADSVLARAVATRESLEQ